jgi:biopolymer transport protein ExbD
MIRSRRRNDGDKPIEINMAPLIDMTFLLLIFFIVTTSFVKETGLEVHRPSAKSAESKEKSTIMVGVSRQGFIYMENRSIDLRSVRANVEKAMADNPDAGVIVVADKESSTGLVVNVIDQCRLAGAKAVSIATKKEDEST